jgi:cytochrome c oxidase subunit 4
MSQVTVSPRIYLLIFAALLVLALATTFIALIDLGRFNIVVAMAIASIKAALIVLFFMHVRYEGTLTLVFAISGFCWLAVMLIFTFGDYFARALLHTSALN